MNLCPGLVITLAIVLSDVLIGNEAKEHKRRVAAFIGGSITLSCPDVTDGGNDTTVQWSDMVYNTDRDPAVIYDSNTGSNQNHTNKDNFQVSDDNKLKISNLKGDAGGQYMCTVSSGGKETDKRVYVLSMYGKPSCSGENDVVEGMSVELACSVSLGAEHLPNIKWTNDRGDVKSKDATGDPFNAIRATNIKASWLDDGATYTCVISLTDEEEDATDSCDIKFSVKYKPRNLKVEPDKEIYAVGEKLYFSAMGNPAPDLTLEPNGLNATGGGPIEVTITNDMLDKNFTFVLRAENSLTNDPITFSKSFRVVKAVSGSPSGLGPNGRAHLCTSGILGLFVLITTKVLL